MSDSDDDNFVKFGTQLEPFDEDNVPRKKAALIQDQYATDEKGRRRFHGAFTGGFSAGYFNTVGTRDGWKPQQFKSSRSDKAYSVNQRPEDFMDEEDTGEFGIAPTAVRATDNFKDDNIKNLKRFRSRQINDQPIPGTPVLQDFLVPARERIGIKLLKKMGWKPGQGIGPRITKKEKSNLEQQSEIMKKYDCTVISEIRKPGSSDSEISDDEYANITLAPNDCEIKKPVPVDNYFGIGYVGLNKEPILSKHINLFDEPTLHIRDKNKKFSIRGQAFGVGAFEADDEDIYSRDDMSQYDFSLEPQENKKSRWSQKEKSKDSNCLEGFVRATKPYQLARTYEPPILPKDFVPIHKFRQSRFFPPIESPSPSTSKDKPMLNAHSRARILSDSSTFQNTSTVQNVIVRTLNLYGKEQIQKQQNIQTQKLKTTSWMDKINVSKFIKGETIGSGKSEESPSSNILEFKEPFVYDLAKQKRFEKYLELVKTDQQINLSSIQPLSMDQEDRDRENIEFEQAARIQNANKSVEKTEEQPVESLNPEDAMKRAAKMKMFGKLTRRKEIWQPSSIVCKRFNVPEPSVGCVKPDSNKKKGYSVFESMDWSGLSKFEKSSDNAETEISCNPTETVTKTETVSNFESENFETEKERLFQDNYRKVFQTEDNSASIETDDKQNDNSSHKLEQKRDLFKAIFLSSSEDSDSEKEDNDKKVDDDAVKSVLLGMSLNEVNSKRNDSPPRGIFAKLDLDELLTSRKNIEIIDKDKEEIPNQIKEIKQNANNEHINQNKEEGSLDQEVYGPILPSKLKSTVSVATQENIQMQRHIFRSVVKSRMNSQVEGKWVEKTKLKKVKKEKKKHKHKDKEKEKKKKSKKKKH